MGFWRSLITGAPDPLVSQATAGPVFAVDSASVPAQVFGLESYEDPVAAAPRVERRSAMQVPAVKRCRDLVAGAIGQLPVDYVAPDKTHAPWPLFDQPERGTPRSVTMTRTVEDLLLEGVAWWRITEYGWHGYPTRVARLDPRSVTVRKDQRVYVSRNGNTGTSEEWVPDEQLIRFDSPNDGLLVSGARAVRTCLRLDAAAANYADGSPPVDYFTPSSDADPADDDDIAELLQAWKAARRAGSTAYVPAALQYNVGGWDPQKLQLHEARQHAVLEIARSAGVDPEELGVSTTSRTYANQFDRRKAFLDFTLGPYMTAVQDRLSMPDVSQRGYVARFNLSAFLRSDDLTRYTAYEKGLAVGAIDPTEVRDLEDRPPLSGGAEVTALPAPAPQEETA